MEITNVKLVLLGESNVGKSSIVLKFVENVFQEVGQPTVGAALSIQTVQLEDRIMKFHIWDTAGQEKYRSLASLYYQGAKAALIVFDITDEDSFGNVKYWVNELREAKSGPAVIAIVGNKLDLESKRKVDQKEAENFANSCGCIYNESSARTGANIREIFRAIAERVPPSYDNSNIFIDHEHQPRKNVCC
jgi:Ras-related protein Rab-5C